MFQRRTRAPFPMGAILIIALLLFLIVYYWVTNKPPQVSPVLPPAELPDTSARG